MFEENVLHGPINANGKKKTGFRLAEIRSLRTRVQYATKNRPVGDEEGPGTPPPDFWGVER